MKSNDPTERREEKSTYGANLFGFDDLAESKASYSKARQSSPPAYPKVVFENKAIQDKQLNQSIQSEKLLSQSQTKHIEEPPAMEDNDDDDDLNIERIKKLLQATKMEIEKMNTSHADEYNSSFKTAIDSFNKENKTEIKTYDGFGYRSGFSLEKPVTTIKHDPILTVKQPFNPIWENQRRILGDIGNRNEIQDDDIPAPQTLSIDRHVVTHSPKKTEDISLNFRSFRRSNN